MLKRETTMFPRPLGLECLFCFYRLYSLCTYRILRHDEISQVYMSTCAFFRKQDVQVEEKRPGAVNWQFVESGALRSTLLLFLRACKMQDYHISLQCLPCHRFRDHSGKRNACLLICDALPLHLCQERLPRARAASAIALGR